MKRIILYILLLVGTGCKVTQQPVNKAEQQPDSSLTVKSEGDLHAVTDSINTADNGNILQDDVKLATDSLEHNIPDSLTIHPDSIGYNAFPDSLITDSVPKKKGALEATVDYQAKDSIVWTTGNMAYLFGEGDVKYQDIELKAEFMQMKMDSSVLYAVHGVDSLGEEFGHPLYSGGGDQNLEAKEMFYNFKTRKAVATHVVTQQGEGYVTAQVSKKMANDVINMGKGKYTTCDEPDGHQHFYIALTKAKTRPGKDIVTGPVYLVVEDVPLFPLVLPFAYFPFTDTYSSGILMPTYGDEMSRGFFLRNGGYYFALSDYFDFAATGEIYTKGSWGLTGKTSYRKRYKYSGSFDVSYATTKLGDKGIDQTISKDFKVVWQHSQDPKSNPYRTISANINYSQGYDRKNLNSLYTPAATDNNKASSVSFSKRFPNKPVSISATMNINQRSQDSTVTMTLPDLTISMSRIYPLKRKNPIGNERWYEKISVNYNGQLRNSISTKDYLLFKSNLIKDWKNGMQHKTQINATYNILNNLNISPNISYTERWYTNKIDQAYDPNLKRMAPSDTTYGFNRVYDYNASVSASTTIYGMFEPVNFLKKLIKVTKIRHKMDPSLSFSATPDFGDSKYGFYRDYTYINAANTLSRGIDTLHYNYSPFTGQLFGVPNPGKSGNISFSLDNNIEAKIPDENEPSGERLISIIDKFSINTSYNLIADSFNLHDFNVNLRLKWFKSYPINLNMIFDPYPYRYDKSTEKLYRVDKLRWTVGKGIGRLRSTGSSYSFTLNNDTFKKWFGGGDDDKKSKRKTKDMDMMGEDEYGQYDPNDPFREEEDEMVEDVESNKNGSRFSKKKQTTGEYDDDGYYNAVIPWSLSFNYSISLGYDQQKINIEKEEFKYKITHALSFNGNIQPTKNWRINFNATYDVEFKKISYMTCTISRTMHCFQMSASVIPIGPYKSYSFSISANSSMLKDLKYDQSSSPYNVSNLWY